VILQVWREQTNTAMGNSPQPTQSFLQLVCRETKQVEQHTLPYLSLHSATAPIRPGALR